ncbi:MAG: glucose-1-phosphate adenylyltransferase, partial [uncultured bacterium]
CLIQKSVIENSIIGLRASIHEGANIQGSLIMGADYYDEEHIDIEKHNVGLGIGEKARIVNAIVDKNARIGSKVVIENYKQKKNFDHPKGMYYIREGIVIIPKNSVIPDGTVI